MELRYAAKLARETAGLSLRDLSSRCGIAKTTLHDIEKGALPALETHIHLVRFYWYFNRNAWQIMHKFNKHAMKGEPC